MQFELKKIGAWSVAKISFILMGMYGFIIGCMYALFFTLIFTLSGDIPLQELEVTREIFPILMILLPIMLAFMIAVFGTVANIIIVVIYNLIARFLGGFELELVEVIAAAQNKTIAPTPLQSKVPSQSIKPYTLPKTVVDSPPASSKPTDDSIAGDQLGPDTKDD